MSNSQFSPTWRNWWNYFWVRPLSLGRKGFSLLCVFGWLHVKYDWLQKLLSKRSNYITVQFASMERCFGVLGLSLPTKMAEIRRCKTETGTWNSEQTLFLEMRLSSQQCRLCRDQIALSPVPTAPQLCVWCLISCGGPGYITGWGQSSTALPTIFCRLETILWPPVRGCQVMDMGPLRPRRWNQGKISRIWILRPAH